MFVPIKCLVDRKCVVHWLTLFVLLLSYMWDSGFKGSCTFLSVLEEACFSGAGKM